jgi:Flp pilus assembly protein protease CpaA
MPNLTVAAHSVLVLAAAALFYAAWTDLREFKIRNELNLVLFGLFVVHAILSGRWTGTTWSFLALDLGIPVAMFLISLVFYARGGVAGGDIKLLTVAFLWAGLNGSMIFTVLLLGFAAIQFGLTWLGMMPTKKGRMVPFGPTIAAALIGTFLSGALDQPPGAYLIAKPYIPLGKDFRPSPSDGPAVPQSR